MLGVDIAVHEDTRLQLIFEFFYAFKKLKELDP